jgi:transposase
MVNIDPAELRRWGGEVKEQIEECADIIEALTENTEELKRAIVDLQEENADLGQEVRWLSP